jgi:hypothetical protein
MKASFCGNRRTAAYLSTEGLPCVPGIPHVLKNGNCTHLVVVHPEEEKIMLSVPVDLPETLHLADGSYRLINGAVTYADGLLTFSHGSALIEV